MQFLPWTGQKYVLLHRPHIWPDYLKTPKFDTPQPMFCTCFFHTKSQTLFTQAKLNSKVSKLWDTLMALGTFKIFETKFFPCHIFWMHIIWFIECGYTYILRAMLGKIKHLYKIVINSYNLLENLWWPKSLWCTNTEITCLPLILIFSENGKLR